MTVVVVDANVLYGIEITDLLLTLATRRMFRVHWSAEILDEVQRNLAKRADLSTAAIAYRIELMNRALPTALAEAPADLIASMPVNDKDRHVLALAVHLGAQAGSHPQPSRLPDCGVRAIRCRSPGHRRVSLPSGAARPRCDR